MADSKDRILNIKARFGWVEINLIALWKRLFSKSSTNGIDVVAQRFFQVFNDHGIVTTQIPRIISNISLKNIENSECLLSVLSNQIIEEVSKLFQVRREWLEGVGNHIYEGRWCYKTPTKFLSHFRLLKDEENYQPVIIFTNTENLNYHSNRKQDLVLVLTENIAKIGEVHIQRYYIYRDDWSWGYSKGRVQLKSMMRIVEKESGLPIPIYRVDNKVLHDIRTGLKIPHPFISRHSKLVNISFEDYVLSPEESVEAKECDELPFVKEYIDRYILRN